LGLQAGGAKHHLEGGGSMTFQEQQQYKALVERERQHRELMEQRAAEFEKWRHDNATYGPD